MAQEKALPYREHRVSEITEAFIHASECSVSPCSLYGYAFSFPFHASRGCAPGGGQFSSLR